MADFVRFTLDDGSEVLFESAESDLVALHGGGQPEVREGGKLTERLQGVAEPRSGSRVPAMRNTSSTAASPGLALLALVAGTHAAPATPPGTGQDPGKE